MLLLLESKFIVFRTLWHVMFTWNPGPCFQLPLCLLCLPSRSHSNRCSACSSSRARQLKWPWPAWLRDLWQGCSKCRDFSVQQPDHFPSPQELVIQNALLVRITLSVPGALLPWLNSYPAKL